VDADTQQILGVTILGIEGGEIMSVLQVAMMGNLSYTAIRDGIFAHPTLAEYIERPVYEHGYAKGMKGGQQRATIATIEGTNRISTLEASRRGGEKCL